MVVPILQMRKSLPEVPKLRPGGAKIEIHTAWLQRASLNLHREPKPNSGPGKE